MVTGCEAKGEPMTPRIAIPHERVAEFCRRWRITEFSLFGSVLRDDFRTDSDVDVLVRFAPDSRWSLLDVVAMEHELEQLFGRHVDVVEREAIEESPNWIRRQHILNHTQVVYVA